MARRSLTAVIVLGILFTLIGAIFSACAARGKLADWDAKPGFHSQSSQTEEDNMENQDDQSDQDHPWGGGPPNHDNSRHNLDLGPGHNDFITIPVLGKIVFRFYLSRLVTGKSTHLVQ